MVFEKQFLKIRQEVKEAIENDYPVVALESTIISHGLPYPQNIETSLEVEQIIRDHGAIPATIAIKDGFIQVGLTRDELEVLASPSSKTVLKVSRRDLSYALTTKSLGATTVAATMIAAKFAGISTFVTGGIGGVHRLGELTLDISADLQELAKTNVAVVCAGVKSILDIGRTLEVLETLGVPVIGYQTDIFPEFYCKGTFSVDCRLDSPEIIAEMLYMHKALELESGVLIVTPIPDEDALDSQEMKDVIHTALEKAAHKGIRGKLVTPYLLSVVREKTMGKSLKANISLVKNNAKAGALIAVAYAKRNVYGSNTFTPRM